MVVLVVRRGGAAAAAALCGAPWAASRWFFLFLAYFAAEASERARRRGRPRCGLAVRASKRGDFPRAALA